MLEYGFSYDSSCMGHDFYPYYLRTGDQWSLDGPYRFGETIDLVELPVTWGLDDFPVSDFVFGMNQGLMAPSAVEESWRGDFDYACEHSPGGIYVLSLHPQTIGRGNRMLMLERLLQHFTEAGVCFEPMIDYARRWRDANALGDWVQVNPVITGANAITE